MSIGFLTNDWIRTSLNDQIIPGGCTYYRCYLPATVSGQRANLGRPVWDPMRGFGVLEQQGVGMFGFKKIMLKLMMDRWTPRQIELAHNLGQTIYTDIDDHFDGLTEANVAHAMTDPAKNKRTNRDHYQRVIELADHVTVSTPFLYEYWSQRRGNVTMVRNGVNLRQFRPYKIINRKPVIGWVGVTGYRNNDLEMLNEWLPDFLEEHDLQFHHAGHDADHPPFTDIVHINPVRVTTSPTVTIFDYDRILNFDIGLVPLNNIPFNEAKSNIKGLEYAAKNIAFVASDLPEYRLLHEDGAGLLASNPQQWRTQVETLMDFTTRKKATRQAYDTVSQRWSIEARAAEWQAVFSEG